MIIPQKIIDRAPQLLVVDEAKDGENARGYVLKENLPAIRVTVDGEGKVMNDNSYHLSLYKWVGKNDASWEPHTK